MIISVLISFLWISQGLTFDVAFDLVETDRELVEKPFTELFLFDDQLSIHFNKEYLYIKPADRLQGQAFVVSVMDMNGKLIATVSWQTHEQFGKVIDLGGRGVRSGQIQLQLEVGHMAVSARIRNQ